MLGNSVDDHVLDNSVEVGLYGQLGLHDFVTGSADYDKEKIAKEKSAREKRMKAYEKKSKKQRTKKDVEQYKKDKQAQQADKDAELAQNGGKAMPWYKKIADAGLEAATGGINPFGDTRNYQFNAGLGVEFTDKTVKKITLDGPIWWYNDKTDPNKAHFARFIGEGIYIPAAESFTYQGRGEPGRFQIITGQTIKLACGGGEVDAVFDKEGWKVNFGDRNNRWSLKPTCESKLEGQGYITMDPYKIYGNVLIEDSKSYRTPSLDIGVATVSAGFECDLAMPIGMRVKFGEPEISGDLGLSINPAVILYITPLEGDPYQLTFASVSLRGDLDYVLSDDFCAHGDVQGSVTVLEIKVDVGAEIKLNGNGLRLGDNLSGCN